MPNPKSPNPLPASAIPEKPPNLSAHLPKLTPRRRQPPPSNPRPLPHTPTLPSPPLRTHLSFLRPTRRILSPKDHDLFLASSTYDLLLSFVFSLTDSVRDKRISDLKKCELSSTVKHILHVLDEVENVANQCPPEDQGGSRFGNKGFRNFLDALGSEHKAWHRKLGIEDPEAINEVSAYFLQSF
ncbi:MAG: Serine/threonine-protein phosphatase 2A activator 2, partial [Candelina submexicana]